MPRVSRSSGRGVSHCSFSWCCWLGTVAIVRRAWFICLALDAARFGAMDSRLPSSAFFF